MAKITEEYLRGYRAGRLADNPYLPSSDSWGAFCIGVDDRRCGRPARAEKLRKSRGHSWRFEGAPGTIQLGDDGSIMGQLDLGEDAPSQAPAPGADRRQLLLL